MAHLQFYQRQAIYAGIQAGKSDAQIARDIEVHRSTVGREIKRSGGRENYKPMQAHQDAKERQCDAMFFRNTYSIGMDLFTVLQKRNAYYRYLFNTHAPFLDSFFVRIPSGWFYLFRNERNRFTIGEGGNGSLGGLNSSMNNSFDTNSGNSNESGNYTNDPNSFLNEFGYAFSFAFTANSFALFLLTQLATGQKDFVLTRPHEFLKNKNTEAIFFYDALQGLICFCIANEVESIKNPSAYLKVLTSLPVTACKFYTQNVTSSLVLNKIAA
jgi:hypothetical protein